MTTLVINQSEPPSVVITQNDIVQLEIVNPEPTSLTISTVGTQGPQGPAGADGYQPPISPTLTYTSGVLTRIDYADASYKVLTYTSGVLTQLDYVKGSVTTRKVFTYSGGLLVSITQTVI